ncbi:hypothetical protein GGU10DRAFT_334926 [Lentinula aff. detonsa]|uniref:Uncharacterized protein n=1 Tax=Lentinula aff. detonsa TaxID=2804958 RepID=A0AA38K8Z2_9AGAR|nr:hypothetical protein GGU10DRAFT_334926 [Lentinula aff. detonsa]
MASPILKLSLALQAAFNDPEVLIYTKGVAFEKLESLMHAVMSKDSNESHLYGLLFRWLSDICIASFPVVQGQDNSKPVPQLECYNQADYRVTEEGTTRSIRIPDYTVFVVDSQLRPAFTVEVKPLAFKDPGIRDWRLNPESRKDALVHFGNTISQLREQAQYVFATYPYLQEHYAFLQVGYFFSVLLFKKENEKKVCDLETPILMGEPVNSYNEVFRYVISIVLKKHGFVLQNSWLSPPEAGYDFPEFEEERNIWGEYLLKGYSAKIGSHMDHRKQERAVDEQLTPENLKDADYIGPPTTPTPSHRTLRNRSTTAASSSSTRGGRGRRTGN